MQSVKEGRASWREPFLYLVFGVLTTVVNYGVFWLLNEGSGGRTVLLSNLAAFVAATAFAFATNKQFVFRSRVWRPGVVLREAASFTAARLFSFAIEEGGLYLAAYPLALGRYRFGPVDGVLLAKIALSFLAVLLNYVFSKFLVFAKKKGEAGP